MPALEFWFEYASTYSHIAAQTIEQRAADAGVEIAWRPFLLGQVFMAQGWNDSPFNIYKAKGAYMWRDMERECERHVVAFRRPSAFPRNGLLAARVTAALDGDTRQAGFVRAVYHANFVEDREISDPAVVVECLAAAGHDDPATALEAAGTRRSRICCAGAPRRQWNSASSARRVSAPAASSSGARTVWTARWNGPAAAECQSVAAEPRMAVTWLDRKPPLPCTSATSTSSTCRAPAVPAICSTASTRANRLYMPG